MSNQRSTWNGLTIILGREEMAAYMRCSTATIDRLIRYHSFPACPLPSNKLATTVTLISAWMQARADIYRRLKDEHRQDSTPDQE
jgi:hypothetical protein